jgi:hypothetical protein
MADQAISPVSVLAKHQEVNPSVKQEIVQPVPTQQQEAVKTQKTEQTDTVTLSRDAVKLAAGSKNMEWVRHPPWKIQYKE